MNIRLSGEPDEITAALAALAAAFDLAEPSHPYPNRHGFGHRIYVEARARPEAAPPMRVNAHRADRRRLPE